MKLLITGGNRGAGQEICDYFGPTAKSVSRSNGFDIGTKEGRQAIIELSHDFDIFVNHAHNGHIEGQTQLLYEVFSSWKERKKVGYIFNTGSIATYLAKADFQRYAIIKRSLDIANQQCCKEIENGICKFRMTLLKPGTLDASNGVSGSAMAKMIEFLFSSPSNILYKEIVLSSIQDQTIVIKNN